MKNKYEKTAKETRKKVSKLTLKQQKQILKLYDDVIKEFSEKVSWLGDKEIYELWRIDYLKELKKSRDKLKNEIEKQIVNSTNRSAEIVINTEKETAKKILNKANINLASDLNSMFSNVQENVVRQIIEGNLYKDKKTLSDRIWKISEEFEEDIQYTINKAILEKKSAVELSEDLAQFLKEPAKREVSWGIVYPRLKNKKVYYNAMRLARTSINHAYQNATIESCKMNPYVTGIEWRSALIHGRTCQICIDRHGQIFDKNDVPLDHANGLCSMLPYIDKSLDEIAEELRSWVYGEENETLDKWYQEYGEYFINMS